MHSRIRPAVLLQRLLLDYLRTKHGDEHGSHMWAGGLVAHATPVCKVVRVEGADVWLQATTPPAGADDDIAVGGPPVCQEDLRLWCALPGSAIGHAVKMLNAKSYAPKMEDLIMLVAIGDQHPDRTYAEGRGSSRRRS